MVRALERKQRHNDLSLKVKVMTKFSIMLLTWYQWVWPAETSSCSESDLCILLRSSSLWILRKFISCIAVLFEFFRLIMSHIWYCHLHSKTQRLVQADWWQRSKHTCACWAASISSAKVLSNSVLIALLCCLSSWHLLWNREASRDLDSASSVAAANCWFNWRFKETVCHSLVLSYWRYKEIFCHSLVLFYWRYKETLCHCLVLLSV